MKKTAKKWILLVGCMAMCLGGCGKTPEEKAEKLMEKGKYAKAVEILEEEGVDSDLLYQAKRGYKYSHFDEEPTEKEMKEAIKEAVTSDSYFQTLNAKYSDEYAVGVPETDRDVIDEVLTNYYGTWYLEGSDKECIFDEFELFGKEYGVLYAAFGTYDAKDFYTSQYLVELCYLNKPKERISVVASYCVEVYGEIEYSVLYVDGVKYISYSETELEQMRTEVETRRQMQTLEEPVKNRTLEAAKEKISNMYEKEGINTILAYSEMRDYYIDYDEDTITCNMEIFYCESALSAAFGLGETYYAVAEFRIKENGDLTMVSIRVD